MNDFLIEPEQAEKTNQLIEPQEGENTFLKCVVSGK